VRTRAEEGRRAARRSVLRFAAPSTGKVPIHVPWLAGAPAPLFAARPARARVLPRERTARARLLRPGLAR